MRAFRTEYRHVCRCAAVAAATGLAACAGTPRPRPVPRPDPPVAAVVVTVEAEPVRATPVLHAPPPAPLASAEGDATYYADALHGRPTASGVMFDNHAMFAAHREYPFGTVLRVTNLANGRSVDVVVLDRGPHGTSPAQQRTIIDVSRRAAEELGFVQAGRTRVRIDVLAWGG